MSSVTPGKLVTPDTSTFTNANNIATTTIGSNGKYLDNNIKITKANSDGSLATITNTTINGETVSILDGEKIVGLSNLNFTPITTEDTSLPETIKLTKENLPTNVAYINQTDNFLDSSVRVNAGQIVPQLIVSNEDEGSNGTFPNQLSGNILVNVNQILGLNIPDQATIEANVKESIENDTDFISDIADSVEAEIATGANVVTLNGEQIITGVKDFSNGLKSNDIAISNTLNINNPEKYEGYPNVTQVNGLYIYAIQSIDDNTLRVFLTDDRQAFLNNLVMDPETSLSGATVYRGKFRVINNEDDLSGELANIVEPFGGNYEVYSQVASEADYTLYLSLFTWNDKINLCSTSYYAYSGLTSAPYYIEIKSGAATITDILNVGLGTVSENDPSLFSWFRGLIIPTGYTESGSDDLIYNLWTDPGVDFTTNSLALGDDNFSAGISSITVGTENKTFSRYNAAIGRLNNNYGYCSGVIGRNNSLNAQNSFVAGSYNIVDASAKNGVIVLGGRANYYNTVNAEASITLGFNNNISASASTSHTLGTSNTINSSDSICVGLNNTASNGSNIFIFGDNNTTNTRSYIFGANNSIAGNDFTVVGRFNTVSSPVGSQNLVCGENLETTISSSSGIKSSKTVYGRFNKDADAAVILGCGASTTDRKNIFTAIPTLVSFEDIPVKITNWDSSNLFTTNKYIKVGNSSSIANNITAAFSAGNVNNIADGHNYCGLLGSWLTSSGVYQTILGVGNDTSYEGRGTIIGDGAYGGSSVHNAIIVKPNQGGIDINTKTNFNSDIYVKTDQDHIAKLVFTEVNGSVTISAVLVNQ